MANKIGRLIISYFPALTIDLPLHPTLRITLYWSGQSGIQQFLHNSENHNKTSSKWKKVETLE